MKKTRQNSLPDIIRRLFLSWLSAAALSYWQLPGNLKSLEGLDGIREISFPQFVLTAARIFCALFLLSRRLDTKKAERYGIPASFGLLSLTALHANFSLPFFCAVLLVFVLLGVYAVYGMEESDSCKSSQAPPDYPVEEMGQIHRQYAAAGGFVGMFAFLFFVFVSIWTVFRVLTYSSPSFDFGIFSQMFHQMQRTGLPYTTLERDGRLSHFHVHVSPIYYLMLPVYCIFPFASTLQILQAAILASASIPAWKLCRKHGCGAFSSALLCLMLLLYPAYSGGASYDLHENAFLTPLLLWLFYAIDCQNKKGTALSAFLTLLVKEDAAVYVAVIGLWLLLRSTLKKEKNHRRETLTGSLLFLYAVTWFLLVTGYLSRFGDGVMTNRYQNFMYDGSASLAAVIKASILSPMKVLYECMDSVKLPFLLLTAAPLCGMPLLTRRYERLLLLIPYILVNLMSDYKYQHDIFFQYTFGSAACLFYLTTVNYADFPAKIRRIFPKCTLLLSAVSISAVCFGVTVMPKALRYPLRYYEEREHLQTVSDTLKTVPEDASVTASSFYCVPLANRDVLYDLRYSSKKHLLSTEYIVLGIKDKNSYLPYDTEKGDGSGFGNLVKLLETNGYQPIIELERTLVIYKYAYPLP